MVGLGERGLGQGRMSSRVAHPGWTVSASQHVACAQPEAKSRAGISEILEGLSLHTQEVVFEIVGSVEGLTHRNRVARYLDLNCSEEKIGWGGT